MLISMLKKFTKGKDLVRPGMTRFATAYLTLSCLNDNKISLMSMFSSNEWKSSRFSSTPEGRKVQRMALDSRLWKNIIICLKAFVPLMTVLRLVDSDEKPAMGFIYDGMDCAKEKIKINFGNVKKSYEPMWNIIDERWDNQLHRPLHAAAYYLNPHFHYDPNFRDDDVEVKQGLYNCMARLVSDLNERSKIGMQLADFHYARGLFGLDTAVHTKRRNRLHQRKMNDLVYVMYNLKLKSKQVKKNLVIPFDELHSDDEWITEEGDANLNGENVQPPPLRDENENVDDGGNVEPVGGSTNQPLDNLEDLVFDDLDLATSGKGGLGTSIGICIISSAFGIADAHAQGGMVGDLSYMLPEFIQSLLAGMAASGALTSALRLITKAAFENSEDGLRKGAILFFAITTFFELLCVVLYAFVFPKLPIVKYYRSKAASEGAKTVSADLAAEDTGSHSLGSWYALVLIAMYNVCDLIRRYIPLLKVLKLESRKLITTTVICRFLFVPAFYFTAKYGTQGWMIMLTSFLGLSNGYLTVCVLTSAPKGYKGPEQNALGNLLVLFLLGGIFAGVTLD
ncbi:Ribonuclease H-like superfamily [Sesbania bispinosa]|nr:Ribonuclease H-like superfamily [Sesbania bispinosa]